MLTDSQKIFLRSAFEAAKAANHVWPNAAACEAAVETAWGTSRLYLQAHNVFGSKVPQHPNPAYGVISLPTSEVLNGKRVTIDANFVSYPTVAQSFEDRMATLVRLSASYPHYEAALDAPDPETFLAEVSKSWATDPNRAATCISILHAHADVFTDSNTE